MNPTIESPGYISGFTAAFFEGTGWYKVDQLGTQHYDWGKDDGCDHFFGSIGCPSGPEFCSSTQLSSSVCTPNFYSKVEKNLLKGILCRSSNLYGGLFYKKRA